VDPFTLGALGIAAYTLLKKPRASSGGVVATAQPPNSLSVIAQPTNVQTAQNAIANTLGGIPIIGNAIASGVAVGTTVDKTFNGNSNGFSQAIGGLAVATITVSAVLVPIMIAVGLAAAVAWPVAGIIIAVAVLTYAIVVIVQDLVRLQYGQNGARLDFVKQFNQLYSGQCQRLASNPTTANIMKQSDIERQVQPFVEGFMARLNWSSYQSIMAKKGIIVSGSFDDIPYSSLIGPSSSKSGIPFITQPGVFPGTNTSVTDDLLWHVNWFVDRGYLVANCLGCRGFVNPPDFGVDLFGVMNWEKSKQNDWVRSHCPSNEMLTVTVPDPTDATIALLAATGFNPALLTTPSVPVTPSTFGFNIAPVASSPNPAPVPAPLSPSATDLLRATGFKL
jgi:hypothetical protein